MTDRDYGMHWEDNIGRKYRVSWCEPTGELYAEGSERRAFPRTRHSYGHFSENEITEILAEWPERVFEHCSLSWVEEQARAFIHQREHEERVQRELARADVEAQAS